VSGIRLLVVDDNPHVTWAGRTYPVNATFHRFLAALLDVPGGHVAELVHAVPLRAAVRQPATLPVDERIRVAGTAPFDGIAGFLRHARGVTQANTATLAPIVEGADLVLLRLPASNAILAGRLARRSGTPVAGWVAGNARSVGLALPRNVLVRGGAGLVGLSYDVAGRWAAGGHRITVGRGIVRGDGGAGGGVVASLVEPTEVRDVEGATWQPHHPVRIAWAGRVAHGKGLQTVFEVLATLGDSTAVLLGDGPARPDAEREAARLGVERRVEWRGHVADRDAYLTALAEADVLLHPSGAEGFPKVVLDAMAIGLPVVAQPAGELRDLAAARLLAPIRKTKAHPATHAVLAVVRDPVGTQAMRERASAFAADHTRPAEAARLVARLRAWWPELPWD